MQVSTRRSVLASIASTSVIAAALLRGDRAFGFAKTPTPTGPVDILQSVLGFLQTTCSVVADIGAVTALIPTFPLGTAAATIANAVCKGISAATTPPVKAGEEFGEPKEDSKMAIGGAVYPTCVVNGVVVPWAHIGTPQAAHLMKGPLAYVVINGKAVPYNELPKLK